MDRRSLSATYIMVHMICVGRRFMSPFQVVLFPWRLNVLAFFALKIEMQSKEKKKNQ